MAKASFLCGLLLIAAARSAVPKDRDGFIKRVARSPHCSECESHGPPPPVFQTHNWSGVERNADGINGVFSGAAAAADTGLQTAGQAFSLASSGLGAGLGAAAGAAAGAGVGAGIGAGVAAGTEIGAGVNTDADAGVGARISQSGADGSGTGVGTGIAYGAGGDASSSQSSFGRSSNGYGGLSSGGYGGSNSGYGVSGGGFKGNSGFGGGQAFKTFRETHYTYGGNKHLVGQTGQNGYQRGSQYDFDRNAEQTQSGGFGDQSNARAQSSYNNGGGYGGSNGYGSGFSGRRYGQHDRLTAGSGFSNEQQQGQFGSEARGGQKQEFQSSGGGQWESGAASSAGVNQQAIGQGSFYSNGGGYGGGLNSHPSGHSGKYHRHHEKFTAGSGFSNEQQQRQFGSELVSGNEQQVQSSVSGSGSGSGSGAASALDTSQQARVDTQSALNGALDLASQGVKASQQAQPGGCATCDKGNYALSNAKSHSGNAIAVSVGG